MMKTTIKSWLKKPIQFWFKIELVTLLAQYDTSEFFKVIFKCPTHSLSS